MRTAAIPAFLPSTHGFGFVNRWPPGPAFELRARYLRIGIGEVAEGLCGGMCFAAADRFLRGEPPPAATTPPAAGTSLFEEIARRQLDSLELGLTPLRFWWAAALLQAGRWTRGDQVREWRAIRADIEAGRPAMLGLVRSAAINPFSLTTNHQVLGFGFEAGPAQAMIRVYDPNHPGRDDVALTLRLGGVDASNGVVAAEPVPVVAGARSGGSLSLGQTTGEPLLALLRLPYRPAP